MFVRCYPIISLVNGNRDSSLVQYRVRDILFFNQSETLIKSTIWGLSYCVCQSFNNTLLLQQCVILKNHLNYMKANFVKCHHVVTMRVPFVTLSNCQNKLIQVETYQLSADFKVNWYKLKYINFYYLLKHNNFE